MPNVFHPFSGIFPQQLEDGTPMALTLYGVPAAIDRAAMGLTPYSKRETIKGFRCQFRLKYGFPRRRPMDFPEEGNALDFILLPGRMCYIYNTPGLPLFRPDEANRHLVKDVEMFISLRWLASRPLYYRAGLMAWPVEAEGKEDLPTRELTVYLWHEAEASFWTGLGYREAARPGHRIVMRKRI